MFLAVIFLHLLCQTRVESNIIKYRCSDSGDSDTAVTFRPALDGVTGRYVAELCTLKYANGTIWTIDLSCYDNPEYCSGSRRLRRPDYEHSTNAIEINDPTNCTHVCYATNFDLIFSGCYGIKSIFKEGKRSGAPHDSYHMISNNLTKANFSSQKPFASLFNHDEKVSLRWHLGIPTTEFKVEICQRHNNTPECTGTEVVTQNCSVQRVNEVHCSLAPPYGCYHAMLAHEAPWTAGVFLSETNVNFNFCHSAAAPVAVWASASGAWWAGGAALVAGALLAALALRRALLSRRYHKRVLHSWRRNREVEAPPAEQPGNQPVLLLYAREGEHGQKAVAALKKLVQSATGGQVYDVYSSEVTALCAAAPAGWLRALLRGGARVLLLQSPAVAALFAAPPAHGDHGLKLQEPLLGRRAMYREPHFGEQLLQLALRLLAETAQDHHAYHKYYLATYSELETDILQQLVPYRRYLLPDAARVLLQDLAGQAQPDPRLLQDFSRAAREMVRHVHDNPNYLMEELIIM